MAAVALGFSSCKQEDEPAYHNPTTFTISTPALQDVAFRTQPEMTDPQTFNLFCTQPDYGFSAVCDYSALVSLDPECPEETAIALENTTPKSAAMTIKTFELGAAVNKLLGVTSQEQFDAEGIGQNAYKVYFRAVCEIPSIEGSRIVSSNVVSLNAVYLTYAEKKPAWIYICGDVQNEDGSLKNGFLAPAASNLQAYMDNWSLFEPEDQIGQKLYVGTFWLTPKNENPDPANPDDCSQFRFFTDLLGWTAEASLGSNEADFYCLNITDKAAGGFTGDIVAQGLGNWGIATGTPIPVTIVVDQTGNKIYVREGKLNVTFTGRTPSFN